MAGGHGGPLAALQAITAELVAARTPAEAAHAVLTRGLTAMGAQGAGIWLLSDDGAALVRLDTSRHDASLPRSVPSRLQLTEQLGICVAVREARAIFLPDTDAFAARLPIGEPAHAAGNGVAAAALPLLVHGRTLGVLVWSYTSPQRFPRSQRDFAGTLVDLAAQALDRTQLYEIERLQAAVASATIEVGMALGGALEPEQLYEVILGQAARVLPCDHVGVTLYGDDTVTLVASWGEPRLMPGEAWPRTGLWLPDLENGPRYQPDTDDDPQWLCVSPLVGALRKRSVLIVPLRLNGEIVGSFDVSSRTPHRYNAQHLRIATQFGTQATQALRNARLYAAEQERARIAEELAAVQLEQATEAAALEEIGAALNASLDLTALYTCILEQAARVLPCDFAVVVSYIDDWATVQASLGDPRPAVGTRLFSIGDGRHMWMPHSASQSSYLPDTAAESSWRDVPPWIGPDRRRSVVSVTLQTDGVVLGYFSVATRVPHAYSERHRRLAGFFAERALQALRNARLYAAERERADAAEDLARLRSEFIGTVSHELRTPLTAVLGYAEVLEGRWGQMTDARRMDYVRRISRAANRQQRLVDDLLLLGRLDGQLPATRCVLVSLPPLIERAAEEVRASYSQQVVALSGPSRVVVLADAERVVQVLANLIDNAAKYSPEGSPVEISWGVEGSCALVHVRDRGTGVPTTGRSQLFTRFGRIPGSRIRAGRVGTGLGLYLSRKLAHAMDGELSLESTGPTGSSFVLSLRTEPGEP